MFVVIVVTKALVWADTVVNMLAEALTIRVVIEELTDRVVGVDMLADDMDIIVAATVLITLEFAVSVFDVLTDVLASLLAGKIIGVLTGGGVDVKVNALVVTMTVLEFVTPSPLYEFSCCAEFDWWTMTLSNFAGVLHAWMPSYHV